MSAKTEQRTSEPLTGQSIGHFCCCDLELPEGTPCKSLCGIVSPYEEGDTDEVECVVCMDLDASDFCPRQPDHRCKYPGAQS